MQNPYQKLNRQHHAIVSSVPHDKKPFFVENFPKPTTLQTDIKCPNQQLLMSGQKVSAFFIARTMPNFVYITRTMKHLASIVPNFIYIIRSHPERERIMYVARTMPKNVYITLPHAPELPTEGADKKCPII